MESLTIVMLTAEYLPKKGGIATHVNELSKTLVKQGHEVHIIARKPLKNSPQNSDLNLHYVYWMPIPMFYMPTYSFFAGRMLTEIIKDYDVDIAHGHSPLLSPHAVTRLSKDIPYISTIHSVWTNEYNSIKDRPIRSLNINDFSIRLFAKSFSTYDQILFDIAKKLICVSNAVRKEVLQKYHIDKGKLTVIPNAVDHHRFVPLKQGEDEETILYVGRLASVKGLDMLIYASKYVLKQEPQVVFKIVGGGNIQYYEKLARKLQVDNSFNFIGGLDHHELHTIYQNSSVFVLPSFYEGLPTTILEAMSCGMPVVATDIPGISEVVRDKETGLLVPPKDPKALADAIIKLLKDEELRRKMGEAGRKRVEEEFTWDRITKKIVRLYKDAF